MASAPKKARINEKVEVFDHYTRHLLTPDQREDLRKLEEKAEASVKKRAKTRNTGKYKYMAWKILGNHVHAYLSWKSEIMSQKKRDAGVSISEEKVENSMNLQYTIVENNFMAFPFKNHRELFRNFLINEFGGKLQIECISCRKQFPYPAIYFIHALKTHAPIEDREEFQKRVRTPSKRELSILRSINDHNYL